MTSTTPPVNPYVGPRTFSYEQRDLFFGREREARDLLARVLSERLLLFYAQSGAGKSSLLHTRLIPQLREEKGFAVLPVGRVGGDLPAGLADVDNIYAFNLMTSIDQGDDPAPFVHLSLSDFLAHLVLKEGERWLYDAAAVPVPASGSQAGQHYALIVDQFEEIVTAHPARWREREGFFRQLDQAMQADPNLWAVLTLREDYVAALDPYAPFMADRLRGRFYMERMGVNAALDAARRPAELSGRPFALGVAEKLVDDLRQVRVPGHDATMPGQYVEPVQLQVVCYQLWENLERGAGAAVGTQITFDDLVEAGDVNRALTQFYEETLVAVLAEPNSADVNERQLRVWFDEELITTAGTRGLVHQGEMQTGSIPNAAVHGLQRRFLVRAEARGGDAWIELVHDRFVAPIRESNAAWFPGHLSALQRQAALWDEHGRSSGLLLRDAALAEAEVWAATQHEKLESHEEGFLAASRQAQAIVERERRQGRRIRMLAITAVIVSLLAIAASGFAWKQTQEAERQKKVAEEKTGLAEQRLELLAVEQLLQQARAFKAQGDVNGAITAFEAAAAKDPKLAEGLESEVADVRRQVATDLVQTGEQLAAEGDYASAFVQFEKAMALDPPSDTPVYVKIAAGAFSMGSDNADMLARDDEKPQHVIDLPEYWIGRTEVTNAQYALCVGAEVCAKPDNNRWNKPQFAKHPVTNVDWFQATAYAEWVGARLPTEAEWEKACRGTDGRIYPWGAEPPDAEWLNYVYSRLGTWTDVGSYPPGANGLYDMAGNVWEWTSSHNRPYPYQAADGREREVGNAARSSRGGSWSGHEGDVRCTVRDSQAPDQRLGNIGFRVVVASSGS